MTSPPQKRGWRAVVLPMAVVVAAALPSFGTAAPAACADEAEVAVLVRGRDGIERGACVPAGVADGVAALKATGTEVLTRDYGGRLGLAVCAIGDEGNRVDDCPGTAGHWHYWRLVDGRWIESDTGPSTTRPDPAVAEGWTWASGSTVAPPRVASPAAICRLGFARGEDAAATRRSSDGTGASSAVTGFAGVAVVVGAVGVVAARRRRRV